MSKPANLWLSRFRVDVTSNSNRVYANGRQQVEVTVTVQAAEDETLTDQQLDSIALLRIDENGDYQLLTDELSASSEKDSRFDYYAATGGAPQNLLQFSSNMRQRKFYVSSSLPGGSLSTIYAGIRMDAESPITTDVAPFKSSVVIESITPHQLSAEHFELTVEDAYTTDEMDFDVYHLKFKNPNYQIVESLCYGTPSGKSFDSRYISGVTWYNLGSGTHSNRYCYAYAVGDKARAGHDNFVIMYESKPGMMTLIRERYTCFAVRRLDDANHTEQSDSIWGLIDQYGNEQVVKFRTNSDGNLIDFSMHP